MLTRLDLGTKKENSWSTGLNGLILKILYFVISIKCEIKVKINHHCLFIAIQIKPGYIYEFKQQLPGDDCTILRVKCLNIFVTFSRL